MSNPEEAVGWFDEQDAKDPQFRAAGEEERPGFEAALDIEAEMLRRFITKTELARMIDVPPSRVTKFFEFGSKIEVGMLVKIVRALGGSVEVKVTFPSTGGEKT